LKSIPLTAMVNEPRTFGIEAGIKF
jgi:hypothetical protein